METPDRTGTLNQMNNVKDSGLEPHVKHRIAALWKVRHVTTIQRRLLRAAIHDSQKYRRMFQHLPKKTGKG